MTNMISDIFFFYLPPVMGILWILFIRKCVASPKIPRIVYLAWPVTLVPGFGAIVAYTVVVTSIVFYILDVVDIELKHNKFTDFWFKS